MYSDIDILAKLCPNDEEFGREVRKYELQNNCKFMLKILKQYPNDKDLGKYLRSQLWTGPKKYNKQIKWKKN